ncbi:hypothetical protein DZF92_04565 [Clavibacter michiganensis subsp. insidiosus]|uniref:Uncharacterized protein n=1 Tax=Clavibacter michiganensis subsp. insidiosus TaxID=33014 RepID=A0A0D5CHH1_9MICO|nr:hypothetical protein [Clavibacter michiganensis]AJW78730.1 hypothetical protein VO01_05925 [Clavibacter michiganensis subsp. insidiosus]AWG01178.1 hypothetical protein BEH62_06160 [Clavibacter michiganensis subsp. insidiosus]OQJ60262.1 hypothetical protein B5P21_10325 [Clavibacter michiganensis subsp. insidiosus]RII88041.1 hypothetical protein DZF92_04565 [Clavibacter michiganensis subsp. insidiosus]RIJ29930.1 hypothetical protein DZF93_09920 [Clavibacter michiganensis subsp. insidiosus]
MLTTKAHPALARSVDEIDGTSVISRDALAASIAADLGETGIVAFDDAYAERTYVYRHGLDMPARVTRADLDELTRAAVLDYARTALDDVDARARARAAATLRAVSSRATGVTTYLRRVRARVVELLPEIDEDVHDALRAALRSASAPPSSTAPSRTASARAARRADSDAADREQLQGILGSWLPLLAPGEHDLGDVWAAWTDAVARSEKLRVSQPRVARIGRTRFYATLADVTTVQTGAARRRFIVIPAAAKAA